MKKATCKSKKHFDGTLEDCHISHDITGELRQFNQFMEEPMLLNENKKDAIQIDEFRGLPLC